MLYQATATAAFGSLLSNACGKCGNEFCPMKDVREAITGTEE